MIALDCTLYSRCPSRDIINSQALSVSTLSSPGTLPLLLSGLQTGSIILNGYYTANRFAENASTDRHRHGEENVTAKLDRGGTINVGCSFSQI